MKVVELWELRALHHDALVVYAHLLLGCKNVESSEMIDDDPLQAFLLKWKARLVAGGNRLIDIDGNHYKENGLYGAPTSLEDVRIVCWWATMHADHVLEGYVAPGSMCIFAPRHHSDRIYAPVVYRIGCTNARNDQD